MKEHEYVEWLASLKEGDEVYYTSSCRGINTLYKGNVDRINPSGRIVVDGIKFEKNGLKRGNIKRLCRIRKLLPVNEETEKGFYQVLK